MTNTPNCQLKPFNGRTTLRLMDSLLRRLSTSICESRPPVTTHASRMHCDERGSMGEGEGLPCGYVETGTLWGCSQPCSCPGCAPGRLAFCSTKINLAPFTIRRKKKSVVQLNYLAFARTEEVLGAKPLLGFESGHG